MNKKPAGDSGKQAPKDSKPAAKAKPAKPGKAKAKAESDDDDEDIDLDFVPRIEDIAAVETPATGDEKAGLDKVMASLTQIFGGRDFMSDAELDAFLDSKMASGEIPPSAALDPLDEAQSLVYEAWNTEGPEKASLARRALDMSPDCADAYVILAQEDAKTREAALALFKKGVDAGKRALPAGVYEKSQGRFWDVMETRPYMRARLGLAECLWELGKQEDALGHLRELMRLNPADDQGVRYILLQCLLESGADEELGDLLGRYGEDTSPEIRFTRALWLFRREGRSESAEAALAEAQRANPHVPAYLLKRKPLPNRVPTAAEEGSAEEAEAYAAGALDAWSKTLGASDWLSAHA